MPERSSACPRCGSRKRRYDEADQRAWCGGCGHEFDAYQQADGEAELVLQSHLADAFLARWELVADRAGGRGGGVALKTLVDHIILAPGIHDTVAISGQRWGKRVAVEHQRALEELLEPERTRYQSAIKLLEVLQRKGKVRKIEHGVWGLADAA